LQSIKRLKLNIILFWSTQMIVYCLFSTFINWDGWIIINLLLCYISFNSTQHWFVDANTCIDAGSLSGIQKISCFNE